MKKILLFSILALSATFIFSSCDEEILETSPTTEVSGDRVLETTDGGLMAINGLIRFFWQWGETTTGNYHQCFGPLSYNLMADLMGEDFVQAAQGSGWFWYDYRYDVKDAYTSGAWRPYDLWNFYYTVISQANYIIDAAGKMQGDPDEVNYIIGNAYAFRAYAYNYAGMIFARSYIGHEDRLCVPILTEPTDAGAEGKARSTNAEVFAQAMSDINKAIELIGNSSQKHISHFDKYVANGLKARIALYMGDYPTAQAAAEIAVSGSKTMTSAITGGYNDAFAADVLWGAEIISSQGTTNPQFLAHMDWTYDGYGNTSRKCCSKWLYDRVSALDTRSAWWKYEVLVDGTTQGYQQYKFRFKDISNVYTGADHIFMRIPEMYLIIAECQCRAGSDIDAQNTLNTFMTYRWTDSSNPYTCTKTGTALGALTTDETGSLLEEIILQRRIELWGEYGRIYDIKRLRQGFVRTTAMGHPASAIIPNANIHVDDPETFDWVMTIPSAEIDANPLMVQNPIGSYATGNTGDDPNLNPAN